MFCGRSDAIPNPAGDGKVAMVDAGDIATVAAAVLADEAHRAGQVYDVTGATPLSFAEIAAISAGAVDRLVTARPMTSPPFLAMLEGAGVPPYYAAMLLRDQEAIRDGTAVAVSDTVAQVAESLRPISRPALQRRPPLGRLTVSAPAWGCSTEMCKSLCRATQASGCVVEYRFLNRRSVRAHSRRSSGWRFT